MVVCLVALVVEQVFPEVRYHVTLVLGEQNVCDEAKGAQLLRHIPDVKLFVDLLKRLSVGFVLLDQVSRSTHTE